VICQADHGDLPRWLAALSRLEIALTRHDASEQREALMELHPWRKGPVTIGAIDVDAEWRSDWKWDRFLRAGLDLQDQLVLDVGCGNGYYILRMLQSGARGVLGIDPMWLYVTQWLAIRTGRAIDTANASLPATVLPLPLESLPETAHCFDVVFSCGILAHRRSPFDHLLDVQARLRPGGTLVLETLVLQDAPGQVLVPLDRYAQMRNVWFVPDVAELVNWICRVGFEDIELVDVAPTSCEEQRSTPWMRFQSLADGLDPEKSDRTVEGYPAPVRAMLLARAPRN